MLLTLLFHFVPKLRPSWLSRKKGKEPTQKADALTPDERKKQYLWLLRLLVALAIPVLLETLDYTVVATAQARIASTFNRLDLQSYIGTVYLLTSTVFLPLFASLSDVYGRHWTMQTSIFLFLIGSTLSTAAQNMAMMLVGRGIAGIGAAGLITVVRVILADSNSLNTNNAQSAILTILYAIGYCVGPVIGGALTDISFRWVFAINLPCCVVSMVLVFVLLRSHTKRSILEQKLSPIEKLLHIDWVACLLFMVGGILVLLGLNWGSNGGWNSVRVIVCLVVGVVLVGVTIVWDAFLEHKQGGRLMESPEDLEATGSNVTEKDRFTPQSHLAVPLRARVLIPLSVLSNFDVLATSFAAFTSGMVMLVVFYFVALFFVIVSGKSATNAGIQLLYFAPGLGIGTIASIQLVKYLRQPKYPIILGGLIIPISLGLVSMAIDSNNQRQLNGFMVMAGIGVGMTFGPLSLHARFSQPASRIATVVGLNLFFRALGGTIGLAQCGTVTNAKVRRYFETLPASALASLQGTNASSLSSSDLTSLNQINSLPSDVQELVRNAYRNGVRWSFISLIPWACVSVFVCFFLRRIVDSDAARGEETSPAATPSPPGPITSPEDSTIVPTPGHLDTNLDQIKTEKREVL